MKKIKTLKDLNEYCNSYRCKDYIKCYVKKLKPTEYKMFLSEVKRAVSYLIDENYLFYKMFWILKRPFNDLCKELFEELCINLEGYNLKNIITDKKFDELCLLYSNPYLEDVLIQ